MARKTFISYKYSEAQDTRNKILKALGDDAVYYNGETSESPNLTDNKTSTIKSYLSDMLWGTSVTIIILSPNMKKSRWIPWEIEYSLSCYSRDRRQSRQNGIVAVIKKVNGNYDWFESTHYDSEKGYSINTYKTDLLPEIIYKNIFNSSPPKHPCYKCNKYNGYSQCAECKIYDNMDGSYITIVEEDEFLLNLEKYIENAFYKSQKLERFFTVKQVDSKQRSVI